MRDKIPQHEEQGKTFQFAKKIDDRKFYSPSEFQMVLIHGLQNSVMDIKQRRIHFFNDVIGVVARLNKNNNGNVFVLCQTGS